MTGIADSCRGLIGSAGLHPEAKQELQSQYLSGFRVYCGSRVHLVGNLEERVGDIFEEHVSPAGQTCRQVFCREPSTPLHSAMYLKIL